MGLIELLQYSGQRSDCWCSKFLLPPMTRDYAIYSLMCFLDLFAAGVWLLYSWNRRASFARCCFRCWMWMHLISFNKSKQEIITIRCIYWRHYRPTKRRLFALENMVGWGRGDVWPKKLEKERRLKSGSSQLLWVQKTLYANSCKSLKTCWFATSFWNQKRYCPRSEAGIVWTTVGLFCEFWGFPRLPWSQVERGWVIAGVALDKWARRDVDIHRSLLNFPGIPACSYQLWASIFHRFLMSCC